MDPLDRLEPKDKTLLARQVELERLYSKNQLLPRLRAEFSGCPTVDFTAVLAEARVPVGFGLDLLAQMALHKRATLATLVGLLRHHLDDSQGTADLLLRCAEADLVNWSPLPRVFTVVFTVSADVQEDLDRFQYPLPMVVPPRPLKGNRDTGYYVGRGSVILRDNHTEDDVCLDHLERVNQVPLAVNPGTVFMVRNKWRDLDKAREGESGQDFDKRRRAFEKYDRTAKDVMALLAEHTDHFYLTHRYDKRGRVYCQGYHVNYQGTPWNKAVVEFHEKELVDGRPEPSPEPQGHAGP